MSAGDGEYTKPNTVPTPDEFFTRDLKECSAYEIVVLAFIIGKTLKYRKLSDVIAISQIDEGVKISRNAICSAIESLRKSNRLTLVYLCTNCNGTSIKTMTCKTPYKKTTRTTYLYKCSDCGCRGTPNIQYSLNFQGEGMMAYLLSTLNMNSNGTDLEGGHPSERWGVISERDGGHLSEGYDHISQRDDPHLSEGYTINNSYKPNKPEEETKAPPAIINDKIKALQGALLSKYSLALEPTYPSCKRLLEEFENTQFWDRVGFDYVMMVLDEAPPTKKADDPIASIWAACKKFPGWHKDEPVPERLKQISENPQEDADFMESKRQYGLFVAWKSNGSNTPELAAAALRICIAHGNTYGDKLERHLGITLVNIQSELESIIQKERNADDGNEL